MRPVCSTSSIFNGTSVPMGRSGRAAMLSGPVITWRNRSTGIVAMNAATRIACSHQAARCIVLALPTSIPRNKVTSMNQPTIDQCARSV